MSDMVIVLKFLPQLFTRKGRRKTGELHPKKTCNVKSGQPFVIPSLHSCVEDQHVTGLHLSESSLSWSRIAVSERFKLRINVHCRAGHPLLITLWKIFAKSPAFSPDGIAVSALIPPTRVWYRYKLKCSIGKERAMDTAAAGVNTNAQQNYVQGLNSCKFSMNSLSDLYIL